MDETKAVGGRTILGGALMLYLAGEPASVAVEIANSLANHDAPSVVRAWFIGMNSSLSDRSPAQALRDGDFEAVKGAAADFIVNP